MHNFMRKMLLVITVISLSLVLLAGCSSKSTVQTPADFYKGKSISWVVSSGAGSNTDLLSRSVGQYLGKELGCTVKIDNKDQNEGMNFVFVEAPQDGLTLMSKATSAMLLNDITKAPGIKYKAAEFNFIADIQPDTTAFYVSAKSTLTTLDALRNVKGLKSGASAAKGQLGLSAVILFEIMGINGKVVAGYKAPPQVVLALNQGEVDTMGFQAVAGQKDVKDGNVKRLFVTGNQRFPVFPDVPTVQEFGAAVPANLSDAYDLISQCGQAVAFGPGVPAERVEFIRGVFAKLSNNQDLQKEIANISGSSASFVAGQTLQQTVKKVAGNQTLGGQLNTLFDKYTASK